MDKQWLEQLDAYASREIKTGELCITKTENKGKINERLEFVLD